MKITPDVVAFNYGEFSPLVGGRSDLKFFGHGCRRIRNFIPTPQGPVRRRPGTRFVAEVKNSAQRTWLARFVFSQDQAYVMEFGHQYIRFFATHGVVGAPFEVATPYLTTDLTNADGTFALKMVQSGDAVYVVHRFFAPYKLLRTAAATFTFTLVDFKPPPFKDIDPDEVETVYSAADSGAGILFTASHSKTFQPDIFSINALVGAYVYLEQKVNYEVPPWEAGKAIIGQNWNGVDTTVASQYRRVDNRNYTFYNVWTNICTITDIDPATNWITVNKPHNMLIGDPWKVFTGAMPAPFVAGTTYYIKDVHTNKLGFKLSATVGGAEIVPGAAAPVGQTFYGRLMTGSNRPTHSERNSVKPDGNDPASTSWKFADPGYGYGKIVTIPTATTATVDIIENIPQGAIGVTNASPRWAISAWNNVDGWPDNITFFRERLVLARGRQVWASVAGDFENFSDRDSGGLVTADMAFAGDTSSDTADPIRWLVPSNQALLIGTGGDEHALYEATTSEPFGPGNASIRKQSEHGSRGINPATIGDGTLFVQRSGRKVRDIRAAESVTERWESGDMTVLAEHVTKTGIIDMAYQQEPDSVLWAVNSNGGLNGFTVNREQEVRGWHPHRIGGYGTSDGLNFAVVESITTIPRPDEDGDELWMIVRRYINGATKRYVEFMEKTHEEGDNPLLAFYVDSGLTLDNTLPANLIPGTGAITKGAVNVSFIASAPVFLNTHPGKKIHYSYKTTDVAGKITWRLAVALITSYVTPTEVLCTIEYPWPETEVTGAAPGRIVNAVTSPGWSYYATPTLTPAGGGGAGATLQAHMQLIGAALDTFGAGYVAGEFVTASGGVYSRPAILRCLTAGAVSSWEVWDGGDYTTLPGTPGIVGGQGATTGCPVVGGTGAGAKFVGYWGLLSAEITNPGAGYTSIPTINVSDDYAPLGVNEGACSVFITGELTGGSGVAVTVPEGEWRITATTITGLTHLNGQTVDVLGDGAVYPQQIVTAGSITIPEPASLVHVGLPCRAVVQPLPIEMNVGDGSTRGKTKRSNKVNIRFHESGGVKYGRDELSQMDELLARAPSDPMDQAVNLFTGERVVSWPDGYSDEALITIAADQPLPCTVVAITPQIMVGEP